MYFYLPVHTFIVFTLWSIFSRFGNDKISNDVLPPLSLAEIQKGAVAKSYMTTEMEYMNVLF